MKPQCRFGHHKVREDSNRLPRADYDAHSRLCVAPASLNGFLTWRSSNGADSSGIAPIPVRLSLFSSRLLANLRENAFQVETNCAKIEVTTFPSTIRQEHCCCWIRRHRTTAARAIRKTRSAPARHPLTARLLLSGLTLLARLLLRPRSSFRQRPGYSSTRVVDRIPRCAASFILLKAFVTALLRNV